MAASRALGPAARSRHAWRRERRPARSRGRAARGGSRPAGALLRCRAEGRARAGRGRAAAAGATRWIATDPRLAWLAAEAARWRRATRRRWSSSPTARRSRCCATALSARAQLATGVFHEELSPARRDIEVAQFRRRRRPEPPRLDRVRRRGAQLRVLPSARALRPAVEARRRSSSASGASTASAAACRSRSSTSVPRPASAPTSSACSSGSGCSASRSAGSSAQLAHVEARDRGRRARSRRRAVRRRTSSALIARGAGGARRASAKRRISELHRDPYRAELGAGDPRARARRTSTR